jgi:hypothetical protein
MRHAVIDALVPEVGEHRVAGDRLEGCCADEMTCRSGHHHLNVQAALHKETRQLGGLVGGDAAGNAQNDAFQARQVAFLSRAHGTFR